MTTARRFGGFGLVLGFVATLAGVGCENGDQGMSMHGSGGRTLYDRLGGEPAITAVVHDFVGRAANDPKVNFTRKGLPSEWQATPEAVAKLEKHAVQFVCMACKGPQKYEGRDVQAVHADMQITNAEFDAAAADLKASLDHFKVPAKEQAELMDIVGGTRSMIVTVPGAMKTGMMN